MRAIRKTPKALCALQQCERKPQAPHPTRRPGREHIEWVFADEADRGGEVSGALFGTSRDSNVVSARYRAIVRVIRESGCSALGFAEVSGYERRSIQRAMNLAKVDARLDPYARRTEARRAA
jgi:hypothetical protein